MDTQNRWTSPRPSCARMHKAEPYATLFVVVIAAGGFVNDVFHHFGGAGGLQIGGHAAQGDAENIAVMKFRSGTAGAEFQPEAVHQVDVFGPEARRMGAQV